MGNRTDKSGMAKDLLKGIICVGVGVLLVIIGFACISILPLAIVLWVVGAPTTITGLGLIIHSKKNNTYSPSPRSSSSSSSSYDSPKSYRRPQNPNQTQERRIWSSDVFKAVRYLSYGSVYVINASVSETYQNQFDVDLTLGIKGQPDSMLETEARAVLDQATRAIERLGAGASISAHF